MGMLLFPYVKNMSPRIPLIEICTLKGESLTVLSAILNKEADRTFLHPS